MAIEVDDPLVKVVAFRDKRNKTLTVVVVNNHAEPVDISLKLGNDTPAGGVKRIRTSPSEARAKLRGGSLVDGVVGDTAPGTSVTTYVVAP